MGELAKELIKEIKSLILHRQYRVLLISSGVSLVVLALLGLKLKNSSFDFMGISETREYNLNFQFPVEIKKIHVIVGAKVQKGDLLIELDQSDLNEKIRTYESQIRRLTAELEIQNKYAEIINFNSPQRRQSPQHIELASLQQELKILHEEKKNLFIFSEADGVVGEIHFKAGEKANAFSTILSISPERPSYVVGYINENIPLQLSIGQFVVVHSLSRPNVQVEASIASIGSRVAEIPVRLLRIPTIPAWGREVVIELPEDDNKLLIGEKVHVTSRGMKISLSLPQALASKISEKRKLEFKPELATAEVPEKLQIASRVELSGLLYLPDLKKFAAVTDDTNKKNEPWVLFLNRDGSLDENPSLISGLDAMSDIESISEYQNFIYLLSSQGSSEDSSNHLLVEAKRAGLSLAVKRKVELRKVLLDKMHRSPDFKLQQLASDIG